MDKKLIRISLEYIDEVKRVCLFMLKGLKLASKEDLLRHRTKYPFGEFELNGNNKYIFHGRGCKFSNSNLVLDWDFGVGDNWCGLNPWKLADYIQEHNISISNFNEGERIKEEFEQAVIENEMKKKYDLYYFRRK